MKNLFLLSVCLSLFLLACNESGDSTSNTTSTAQTVSSTPSADTNINGHTTNDQDEGMSSSEPTGEQQVAGEQEITALYEGLSVNENLRLKNLIYYLDRPLTISNRNGFTLDGNGCTFIMQNKSEDVIIVENSSNVTLKNFKATHIEPEGPIGCTGSVIQVRNNNNVLIEQCELNGSGIIGVVAYETDNLKVIDNYIYNNSDYGVLYDQESSVEVRWNRFEKNGENGDDHVAMALNPMLSEVEKMSANTNKKGIIMANNTFQSEIGPAPQQQEADESDLAAFLQDLSAKNEIQLKNRIYYLDEPIMISEREQFTLDGNGCTFIMQDKSADVIIVENSTNVTLKNFKATHIEPEGPIGCTGSVIQVRNNKSVSIEQCQLNGSGIIGVVAYGCENLKIVDNYIYNNSEYGVLYDKDSSVEIEGNKFENNGMNGDNHVAKALNSALSEVEKMSAGTNKESIKMQHNILR